MHRSKNFINVTSHLAHNHQMFQAYLLSNSMFEDELQFTQANSYTISEELHAVLDEHAVDVSRSHVCGAIEYKGTSYYPNQYVVIGKEGFNISVGKILLVVTDGKPYFVISETTAKYDFGLGIYNISTIPSSQLKFIAIGSLRDYYPLHSYKLGRQCEHLVLKHSVL